MCSALRKHWFIPPDRDQRWNGQMRTFFSNSFRKFAGDNLLTENQK